MQDCGIQGFLLDLFVPRKQDFLQPVPCPQAVFSCRDKSRLRQLLRRYGIPSPQFSTVGTVHAAVTASHNIGLPVVAKPPSESGSLGVKLCCTESEVKEHVSGLLERTCTYRGQPLEGKVVIEEFLEGDEYSIETFENHVIGITKKSLGQLPHFVTRGHEFPARLPEDISRSISESVLRALQAVGLTWGPAHTEVKLARGTPKIIEINARVGMAQIPTLVNLAYGIDLCEQTIRTASGMYVDLSLRA